MISWSKKMTANISVSRGIHRIERGVTYDIAPELDSKKNTPVTLMNCSDKRCAHQWRPCEWPRSYFDSSVTFTPKKGDKKMEGQTMGDFMRETTASLKESFQLNVNKRIRELKVMCRSSFPQYAFDNAKTHLEWVRTTSSELERQHILTFDQKTYVVNRFLDIITYIRDRVMFFH